MEQERGAEYKTVRGLVRGLHLLQALNASESGRASDLALSRSTGLHRTTVRRLMETLIDEGFVRRSESDGSYRLTLQVRSLSEGFTDDEWVATAAAPAMGELLQKVVWPSDLTMPDGDAMIIRETTHRFSPLSFHRSMVGRRLPILLTAAGRAYFAYCGEEEREDILSLLRSQDDAQSLLAKDEGFIRNLIEQVRSTGYSTNQGDWQEQKKIGAVAVPVLHGGKVLGSLNVIYLNRAVSQSDAIQRYVPALQQAVARISAALDNPESDNKD
ncbi:DNA-binding transcriptional regulator [Crenobacter sp. SG2303]|uniref:DNA-binding transcriptional regulator n=1 Tax=Crenobacter oryzisoli TaxID=3056844 RepID=A0ABT7XRI2_9NEIS|nr:DNA-binding transcriptional regulator [Crenobacter sp. SG2303]MDN0076412.1 DNA-binding transcriptional regulator [Crenobacter sp. SG2303]